MSALEIQQAVEQLPEKERWQLVDWFKEFIGKRRGACLDPL